MESRGAGGEWRCDAAHVTGYWELCPPPLSHVLSDQQLLDSLFFVFIFIFLNVVFQVDCSFINFCFCFNFLRQVFM